MLVKFRDAAEVRRLRQLNPGSDVSLWYWGSTRIVDVSYPRPILLPLLYLGGTPIYAPHQENAPIATVAGNTPETE